MTRRIFALISLLLGPASGLACDYAPADVACGDLTCGEGQICLASQNSCLPVEYQCVSEVEGCVVAEQADAAEFAACVEAEQPWCEFDEGADVLSCAEDGDAGC